MSILSLESVRYAYSSKYQTVEALKDVSCSFEQGLIYAIIGKAAVVNQPCSRLWQGWICRKGDVLFRGVSTRTLDLDTFRRNNVAMIYQSFRLFPLLTALKM